MAIRRPKSNKNPPVFSHEFVIQNHADIVSCVAMIFVVGLMFQTTSPVASLFVAMQHNVTHGNESDPDAKLTVNYTYGLKDLFTTSFYLLICIVVHAVIQEYVLDKVNRRMHLSKVKHSKFNESGQLLTLYGVSAGWGLDILIREEYITDIRSLWDKYPHAEMPFIIKFYFIMQLAYWLHTFPELYFQKVKKDEMAGRIQYAVLYLFFIASAYCLNFTRVALCMLVLHYMVEFVFHLARLLYFADKTELANTSFLVWDVLFVVVRVGTITLAVLTFLYGLAGTSQDTISFAEGNFNTSIIRLNALAAVCMLQVWLMWNFIMFHMRRMREQSSSAATAAAKRSSSVKAAKKGGEKKKVKKDDDSQSSTDQPIEPASENGTVRQRTPKAKRN